MHRNIYIILNKMKKLLVVILGLGMMINSCQTQKEKSNTMENPFLKEWKTPFGVPPFDQIKIGDYVPATKEGIKQHNAEIDAIVNNSNAPTFENTILAFDKSGELLDKVNHVFEALNSAETNDEMQDVARELSPLNTNHWNNVLMNAKLFKRIKAIYDKRNELGLNHEQIRVVEKYFSDFERNGANLSAADQKTLKEINVKLSELTLRFGENVLAETNNNFKLVIDNKADLAGLPDNVIERAAAAAKRTNDEGKWVFTLAKPSMLPFLQLSEKRELREKLYRGYFMRGDNDNDNDNKAIIKEIVKLRDQRAKLLGFANHASYVIDVNMAKTPKAVTDFLMELWTPSLKMAKQDVKDMQAIIDREGGGFKLASWDWWYYAEKLRKEKFNFDEEQLKPYFSLENAKKGIFYVAQKLYGLKFIKHNDLPVYNEEVEAYEVQEADGSLLGILYMDFHPRAGKSVGAWSTSFRDAAYKDGKRVPAVESIVMNFTRPSGNTPALLSFDEVSTLFHEFGHALHGLFTDGPYARTAGNVARDFVELPSQFMENYAADPEVMKVYAKHYKTGNPIPDELIDKLVKSGTFNQGFITGEYVAAALLDMDYHTPKNPNIKDVRKFEKDAMDKIGIIPEFLPRYRSTYFSHIFSGGYSAGYYVYIWAAVLDADAFDAFKQTGNIFDPGYAAKFRTLLAKSGSNDGMVVYKNFRGQEPSKDPLLKKRGLE